MIIIGFGFIAFIVGGVVIIRASTKSRAKKAPIQTVRCPPKATSQESDARYKSITASLSDDIR